MEDATHEAMYRATLTGDWAAAELLLGNNPNLSSDCITEEGDKALHVAAAMKHMDFVQKLHVRMSGSEMALLDGHGYTACCYAAMSGALEIARLMIRKDPSLAKARDLEGKTPLHKAALRGNVEMVSYFLKFSGVRDFSNEDLFDLLLETIRGKMYGVALEIFLGSPQCIAVMRNNEGTALHLLARQPFFLNSKSLAGENIKFILGVQTLFLNSKSLDFSGHVLEALSARKQRMNGAMREDMKKLANKLWEGIQELPEASVLELMKNPPILHIAAEVGNVDLITMVTHAYPNLVWQTNTQGYTIFHLVVKHRHENLLWLFDEIGAKKDLIAMSQDENGNNILHLAGELAAPKSRTLLMTAFEMQRDIMWFEKVKAIVPPIPLCLEMKNKEGHTPRELFSKRHKRLLEESSLWMRNATDSCMLVSTLIFSMVFAAAFAVPGSYNQVSGIPLLSRTKWMTCFVIFEGFSILSSASSILSFLCIMVLGIKEGNFARNLPNLFVWGLLGLSFSVLGVVSVFMSVYFMVYVEERAALIKTVIILVYIAIVSAVCFQIYVVYISLPRFRFQKRTRRHTLFKRRDGVTAATRSLHDMFTAATRSLYDMFTSVADGFDSRLPHLSSFNAPN